MSLSETFGRSDQPWTLPAIPGYGSWRTERGGGDKGGGGLCILYREALTPHHWAPQVANNLQHVENERQWLLIDNGKEKLPSFTATLCVKTTRAQKEISYSFEILNGDRSDRKNKMPP